MSAGSVELGDEEVVSADRDERRATEVDAALEVAGRIHVARGVHCDVHDHLVARIARDLRPHRLRAREAAAVLVGRVHAILDTGKRLTDARAEAAPVRLARMRAGGADADAGRPGRTGVAALDGARRAGAALVHVAVAVLVGLRRAVLGHREHLTLARAPLPV